MVNFADDATLSKSAKNPEDLSISLGQKYSRISEYLTSNKLKINDDKTHMIVMTSGRPKTVEAASKVELRTPSF